MPGRIDRYVQEAVAVDGRRRQRRGKCKERCKEQRKDRGGLDREGERHGGKAAAGGAPQHGVFTSGPEASAAQRKPKKSDA